MNGDEVVRGHTLYFLFHLHFQSWDVGRQVLPNWYCDCWNVRFALLAVNEFRTICPNYKLGWDSDHALIRDLKFQMFRPAWNTHDVFEASGSGDLTQPPPTMLTEAFVVAHTEVLCQLLQTQQQMAQQLQQMPPMQSKFQPSKPCSPEYPPRGT
jgi:hypothetical protein